MANNLLIYFDAINNTGTGTHSDDVTIWSDLSGNGNDGTIYGAVWNDKYLLFDGNSWVNCGQQNPNLLTIEAYVKFNAVGGSNEESNTVVANWQSGGYGIEQSNALHAACINIDNAWHYVYGTAPSTDRAVHLVVSYDGSVIKFYENGVKVSEKSVSGSIKLPTRNTVLSVGSNPEGASIGIDGLSGCVYVIRLYDKALSDAEVLSDYEYDHERYADHICKYLVRNEGVLYTVVDGALSEIAGEFTSELFQTSGIDTVPDGALLLPLSAPEVLCWTDADTVPKLTATVTATPQSQVIITDKIYLTDKSITGIESALATCEGDLIVAVSFDDKQTWKAWNGEQWATLSDDNTGMSKETLEGITFEQWNELYTGATGFYVRVSLLDTTQSVEKIVFDFSN